jgi:hypothetical protein
LLLRLYRAKEQDSLGIDGLIRCLDSLESFYVRRLVCGVPTNALNKITLELCLNLPEMNQESWLRDKLVQGAGGRRWPSDQEFAEALVIQKIYPRRRIARYMLIALEEAYDHKEPVEPSTATIEHIMPQTLSEKWKADLGADHVLIHDKWLDTLGNLTLTGYNSELGNAPFHEKEGQAPEHTFRVKSPHTRAIILGACGD